MSFTVLKGFTACKMHEKQRIRDACVCQRRLLCGKVKLFFILERKLSFLRSFIFILYIYTYLHFFCKISTLIQRITMWSSCILYTMWWLIKFCFCMSFYRSLKANFFVLFTEYDFVILSRIICIQKFNFFKCVMKCYIYIKQLRGGVVFSTI